MSFLPTLARALIAVVALVVAAAPAAAFAPEVLDSVVSVLPEWPDRAAHRERPEGTAVAVLPGGYLATNVHVIGRARRIKVRLHDGRLLPAEVVGRDLDTDIALIKVAATLPVPPIGPEPPLAAPVCAVANQFGLGLSVTCGVVSAVRRSGVGFNRIEDFIQTDTVANPGSSGGALVDGEGRLVGLVSAIFTKQSDANVGVNFAASMALVLRVARDLEAHGRVLRPRLGVRLEGLSEDERATLVGARIVHVAPGAAAALAGLEAGDVITEIAGRRVARVGDVLAAVYLRRPGERIDVVVRRAGETRVVTVELGS